MSEVTTKVQFPASREVLNAAGYRYKQLSLCRGKNCRRYFEWWYTPSGTMVPLTAIEGGMMEHHNVSCPDRNKFKTKKS